MDFFIADLHFGHKMILEHCNRNFVSAAEMDSVFILNWNKVVKPNDNVFILGDFSFHPLEITQSILKMLNGHKYLIKGNHDKPNILNKLKGFVNIVDYLELKHEPSGTKICCFHYPMLSWNQKHRGSWMLHGYCHGQMSLPESLKDANIFDVGIDNLYKVFGAYAPVSLDEIIEHKEYKDSLFVLES